ncbi:MAG: phosphate acyltransferase PlsX [Bacteroidales bacterium]
MKIGLDVMGGDFAPKATLSGAILARQVLGKDDDIVLIGNKELICDELEAMNSNPEDFIIVHAGEVIEMGESPTRALVQKPDSSIAVGFKLMKTGEINAFASAGSSGAMLVGAIYSVNTIQGIVRPTTTAIIPKVEGGFNLILDVGTNPDAKPDVLYQFAILGSLYAEFVHNIKNPKIGLLNIGEEENKGNLLAQSAYNLMKGSEKFNFVGNIEGRHLFRDKADVIVCDGFTGNIVLKQAEAFYRILVKRGIRDEYLDRFNYENYGGTPILGVNGTVIVGHGISNDKAIKNMILLAKEVHEAGLTQKIKEALIQHSLTNKLADEI